MIFGAFALAAASGGRLAHTIRLAELTLAKGTLLDDHALDRLRQAGIDTVTAALLEPGDVHEDEAARRIAMALVSPGIACSRVNTGRANLAAAAAGLFHVDAATVDALNLLHEGLTIATLPNATAVTQGDILVTVKIIPFAIPAATLVQAETLVRDRNPVRLRPFRALRAGLIVTTLPGLKAGVLRGTIEATGSRITGLGGTMLPALRADHACGPIADSLHALIQAGADLLLIAGASATVDRGDVGPAAICAAGGAIDHFGMPVDPGNLICLGHIGAIPAVVLPGCARSPKLNGIDLVLARIFAGEPPSRLDIARMGVGGLLKDTPARPSPRAAPAPHDGEIAALVLAAGKSTRMAPHNKLLLRDAAGHAMVARVVDAVLASRADRVTVVLGHQADEVAAALGSRPVVLVRAVDFDTGMSASLRAGIASLPATVRAAVICLADMPLVEAGMIDRLIEAYDPEAERLIVVPTHHGKRGNPVLWDCRYFPDILALRGDTGARSLLLRHSAYVIEVELGSDAILLDVDTPDVASVWPA